MQAWLRRKFRDDSIRVRSDGTLLRIAGGHEIVARAAGDRDHSVFRASLYEPRNDEEVRTTLTVLRDSDTVWVWVDLERWSEAAFVDPWTPIAPGLVATLLRERQCRIGHTPLSDRPSFLRGDEGLRLAEQVLDTERTAPLVVVTAHRMNDHASEVEQRAIQIQRRLLGIAPVFVLGEGAVSAFSRKMIQALGPGHDVYSGAVRTFLPGPLDGHPRSAHRLVPYHRIQRRPPSVVADLIAAPIQRNACAQRPPSIWRDRLRSELESTKSDDEILEMLARLERERDQERNARARLEMTLEFERESAAELERENDDLRRAVAHYRRELQKQRVPLISPTPGRLDLDPDYCGDVPIATTELPHIVFPEEQWPLADELDSHSGSAVWAKRAWRVFRAMSAYAEAKAHGKFSGNFWDYCHDGRDAAIPTSWIAMKESESTNNNERFRTLRVLPVSSQVSEDGEIYMPAHIKLEKGGYPAPRIHFHDDTGGKTGAIHIGYFGEHLDNKSKS